MTDDQSKQYIQPRRDLGFRCFSFTRYSQKCFIQIYRATEGHGGRTITETSVTEFRY